MAELFGRYYSLIVGQPGELGLKLTGHAIDFDIHKACNSSADKAKIKIYNLGQYNRNRIETLKNQAVVLDAGYRDEHGIVFKGKVDQAWTEKENDGTLVTHVEGSDFIEEMSKTTLSLELKDDTSPKSVIKKIADSLGVTLGKINIPNTKTGDTEALYDSVRQTLNDICGSRNSYWHITDGVLYVSQLGQASRQEVILLSNTTGLIGKPERTTQGIKGVSLMRHQMNPGTTVRIQDPKGKTDDIILITAHHQGRRRGNDWYTNFEGLYRSAVLAA